MTNTYYISPDNKRFEYLPGSYNGTSPLSPENCEIFGWQILTEEIEDTTNETIDDTNFKKASKMFRDVCEQIAEFIDDDTFRGGFEDFEKFINSSAARTSKASASLLASMWNSANEYLKYEGMKIGLEQPANFYRCWEYSDEELSFV